VVATHSLPVRTPEPYPLVIRAAPPHLRPYVLGWAGYRGRSDGTLSRMLPLNAATLIIDFTGRSPLLTGPRAAATPPAPTPWRHGVALGLTPAGMRALLGMPMREVAGTAVQLEDLPGVRAGELAALAGWEDRFGLLERSLTARLRPEDSDALIMHAWRRLQEPGRLTVEALAADLGVSRRYLELGFRRVVGLSPKTVSRIARFQRVLETLSRPSATLDRAVACGYADQPHLTREIRAMAAMTPKELFAFVQDGERPPD
jgi:AraC-like DNA-binding protein